MRRAAGAFVPTDIDGLQLWLRADDCAAVGDGNTVTTWTDRIGAYAFTEATNKPIYRASSIGGRPAIDFDGTNDQLVRAGNLFSNTTGSVMLIVNADTLANATCYANRLAGGTRLVYFGNTATGWIQTRQRDADTADNVRGNTTALATSTDYAWYYRSTGTVYAMQVNGVGQAKTVIAGADTGDWYGDTASRDQVAIGSNAVGEFFNGRIAEVLDFDHDLTADELASLERYLTNRYGITFS